MNGSWNGRFALLIVEIVHSYTHGFTSDRWMDDGLETLFVFTLRRYAYSPLLYVRT